MSSSRLVTDILTLNLTELEVSEFSAYFFQQINAKQFKSNGLSYELIFAGKKLAAVFKANNSITQDQLAQIKQQIGQYSCIQLLPNPYQFDLTEIDAKELTVTFS